MKCVVHLMLTAFDGRASDTATDGRRPHKTPLPADHSCRQPEALGQPTGSGKLNRAWVDLVSRPRRRGERTPAALRGSVMAGGIGMVRLLRRPTSNAMEVVPCMILTLHAQVCYELKEG